MTQEDLEDALDDLVHDLGKYIHLPLSLLPSDASDADVLRAASQALHHTRRGPTGVQSAKDVWGQFCDDVGNGLEHYPGWTVLEHAVEQALRWADVVHGAYLPEHRKELTEDLRAVAPAIRDLRGQIDGGIT